MSLERITVPIEWKASSDDQTLEGYASTFGNVDHGGDVVVKGAFTKTIANIKTNGIPLLADHMASTTSVLGTIFDAKETDKGLWIKARFSSAPSAQDVRIKMVEGHISKLSIGYETIAEKYADRQGKRVRELHELKLWETSAVVFPMNPEAAVSRVKSVIDALGADHRKQLLNDLAQESAPEAKATHNELREALGKALREHHKGTREYAYLRDFDATKIWYELYSDTKTSIFERGYEVDEKVAVTLRDGASEVRAVTTYVPVDGAKSTTLVSDGGSAVLDTKSSAGDEPAGFSDELKEKAAAPAAGQSDEPGAAPDEGVKGWDHWRSQAVMNDRDPEAEVDGAKRAGLSTVLELLEADPDLQPLFTETE